MPRRGTTRPHLIVGTPLARVTLAATLVLAASSAAGLAAPAARPAANAATTPAVAASTAPTAAANATTPAAAVAASAAGLAASAANAAPAAVTDSTTALPTLQRVGGATRYDTDAQLLARYPTGVAQLFVATGATFPDALAAAAAAGRTDPVALVAGGAIPDAVLAQVQRLQPGRIVLVGGPAVLPDSVGATLAGYASGGWTRLAGSTRYGTAAAVSAATFAPGVPVAYIATGLDFPDALTGSALGARLGGPVLLTGPTSLPTATAAELARLHPAKIVVLGSSGVVSDAVLAQLSSFSGTVQRAGGASRYATNLDAIGSISPVATLVVATGSNFPDALAGGAMAARLDGALLLVGSTLTSAQIGWLQSTRPGAVLVVGGTGAVPSTTATTIDQAAGGLSPTSTGAPPAGSTTSSGPIAVADPTSNLSDQSVLSACWSAPGSSSCLQAEVAALNSGRSSEGLPAFALPSNWSGLTPAQQLLVATNAERTVRNLPPIAGLVSDLQTAANTGATNNDDPRLSSMTANGHALYGWASNWAWTPGGPLLSVFEWMYNDGYGSGNIACTSPTDPGCWGHRHNILAFQTPTPGVTLVFGAAEATTSYSGYQALSDATILAAMDTSGGQPSYVWKP